MKPDTKKAEQKRMVDGVVRLVTASYDTAFAATVAMTASIACVCDITALGFTDEEIMLLDTDIRKMVSQRIVAKALSNHKGTAKA